jgi:hypothetical protein
MKSIFNLKNIVVLAMIVFIILLRTIAPLADGMGFIANFSGLGAVAIFSGAQFKDKSLSFITPIITLLISDFILSLVIHPSYLFYQGWYFVYGAFLFIAIASKYIMRNVNAKTCIVSVISAVLIHWLVTDFGVWIGGNMYPKTLMGFYACLVAAIPFEINFLLGTVVYSGVLFFGFELTKGQIPALREQVI